MTYCLLNDLCYPKPNVDDFYVIYEFEAALIENIVNGKSANTITLYEDFFKQKTIYNIIDGNDLQAVKSYIISISLLACHQVIKKGVSPYSAMAKYHAFFKLIEKSTSKADVINIGKIMIQAYATQTIQNINPTDNIPIRKALHYIHDNLGENLTLEMVSNYAGFSKCYFCTQFKKEIKMSFSDYLTHARIEKSKYLLCHSNQSILDIAILIGFNSQSYFTSQFKKYTGLAPKEFRETKNGYIKSL